MIDLILPCYNQGDMLPRMLASISAQKDKNFKLILIANGSNDDTDKIIKDYNGHPAIKIYHDVNMRGPEVFDKGISLGDSEWCTIISADCWLDRDYTQLFNLAIKATNADIIQMNAWYYQGERKWLQRFSHLAAKPTMFILGPCTIYKRSVWKQIKFATFDNGYEDSMFYFMCLILGFKFMYWSKAPFHYLIHNNSESARLGWTGSERYNRGIDMLKKLYPSAPCWKFIPRARSKVYP